MGHEIKTIGILGAGNMGTAIIAGLCSQGSSNIIHVHDIDESRVTLLAEKYSIKAEKNTESLCGSSDVIIIAVKPDMVAEILDQLRMCWSDEKILVCIAAGITTAAIEKRVGSSVKVIRVMPNTPALAGKGMSVLSPGSAADDKAMEVTDSIFRAIGRTSRLPEKLMDSVTGLSGSGPAYVFTFIQALADAGVKEGIPRDTALLLAAQTVLGSAQLVLENMEDPFTLRGRVTSPGGTTIAGIHVLEKAGFSGIVMDAVEAAVKKSRSIGEQ